MSDTILTTKSEYVELFDKFAKTAIKKDVEDLYYLYGHNINVQQFDNGMWDVCLCNQKEYAQGNLTAYLGTGKLNNLCATLPDEIDVRDLNGERYFQIPAHDINWLKSWLLDSRVALGIKKRVKVTESRRQAFISSVSAPCGELK